MSQEIFTLPPFLDITATVIFAATGAMIAVKRGYDFLGISIIALVSGAGGGIIRDAIFLNTMPAFILDWRYIFAMFAGVGMVLALRSVLRTRTVGLFVLLIESLALGMYGVYGAQKALFFGLSIYSAAIVGVMSAIGGGISRDTLMGGQRTGLNPGQFYGILALVGVAVYLTLRTALNLSDFMVAWIAIATVFCGRLLAIKFDWHTVAVEEYIDPSEVITSRGKKVVKRISRVTVTRKSSKEADIEV